MHTFVSLGFSVVFKDMLSQNCLISAAILLHFTYRHLLISPLLCFWNPRTCHHMAVNQNMKLPHVGIASILMYISPKSCCKCSVVTDMTKMNQFFLHDRPWISPWIKSVANELDITIHVIESQFSSHCDVISTRTKTERVKHGDDVYTSSCHRNLWISCVV